MTWHSTSTDATISSKSSVLFGLNEDDKSEILVYRYRTGSSGLEITSQQKLCKELDANQDLPFLRVTKKKIPRGNSRLEVHAEDLLLPEEARLYGNKPTMKASVANVGLPSVAYWKRLAFNSFPELYIVSKSISGSPTSSTSNSPENSQHVSPATTFPVDTAHPPTEQ
ncbi:hypothetical protein GQ43DRAFT_365768 [Delitschia confertaspora ATCC 74209]|uniref:Uncharacterized protein n=1 Tax=Delitschia confertaspora ATCC 74209 TaxID=1513339 RepID=A0A9P4JR79_9PLEO|nr:hypothetical protein GQ43DRAFT_365768 [Delitschia confertaspora ATCC 74209]